MTTDERLVRIEDKLDGLSSTLTESCALHRACLERQGEHRLTLYGDGGRPGLKAEVADLQHSRRIARCGFWLLWTGLFAVIAAMAGGMAQGWFTRP